MALLKTRLPWRTIVVMIAEATIVIGVVVIVMMASAAH